MSARPHEHGGLSHAYVAGWKRRIGTDQALSPAVTQWHLTGRSGLAQYSRTFAPVTAENPDGFEVIAYHRGMSTMMVHCELSTPRATTWTGRMDRADAGNLIAVAVHGLDGRLRMRQSGTETTYASGELVVVPTAMPFAAEVRSICETSMLLIPADLLRVHLPDTAEPPIVANSLLSRATAQFVRRFVCEAIVESNEVSAEIEYAVINLVRSALGSHDHDRRHSGTGTVVVREAVRDLIEMHFIDQDFTADSIAHILHMSRRHLYRHFSDADESPAAMITTRRLHRARELLSAPEPISLEQVARQSGFASSATLRNRFRAEYGQRPSEFREQALHAAARLSMVTPHRRLGDR